MSKRDGTASICNARAMVRILGFGALRGTLHCIEGCWRIGQIGIGLGYSPSLAGEQPRFLDERVGTSTEERFVIEVHGPMGLRRGGWKFFRD
jgi:hypothetical protein